MSPVDTQARAQTLPDSGSGVSRRRTVMTAPRWLLAGLLLSCLFPAGLSVAQVERVNLTLASIQLLVPAVIRAENRRQGLRSLRKLTRTVTQCHPSAPRKVRRLAVRVHHVLRGLASAIAPRAPPVLS